MTTELFAKIRDSKKANFVRKEGYIPAIVYGNKVEAISVAVQEPIFRKALKQAGESTLVDLKIEDSAPVKVLIHAIQYHPTKQMIRHVDFYQVNMKEKVKTEIELDFQGVSPAVSDLGGTLVKNMDSLEIECLPGDLVASLSVDLSRLITFEDAIMVKDIILPKGLELLTDPDLTVALVEQPRSEAEIAALTEAVIDEKTAIENIEAIGEKDEEESVDAEA